MDKAEFKTWCELKKNAIKAVTLEAGVEVGVRAISTTRFLAIAKQDDVGIHLVAESATDFAGGGLLFASADEVRALPSPVFFKLLDECQRVNGIDVEKSAKN